MKINQGINVFKRVFSRFQFISLSVEKKSCSYRFNIYSLLCALVREFYESLKNEK